MLLGGKSMTYFLETRNVTKTFGGSGLIHKKGDGGAGKYIDGHQSGIPLRSPALPVRAAAGKVRWPDF